MVTLVLEFSPMLSAMHVQYSQPLSLIVYHEMSKEVHANAHNPYKKIYHEEETKGLPNKRLVAMPAHFNLSQLLLWLPYLGGGVGCRRHTYINE